MIGTIKSYKGIDTLLDEFEKIDKENAYLLIAGKTSGDMLSNKILDAAKRSNHIIFHSGFVADEDVASYFRVSDIVCLSYKAITTSDSALLALTFQKPLIAPSVRTSLAHI